MASGGHIRAEESKNERQFNCPVDMIPHCRKVLDGEYDIAYEGEGPLILDVGANCGAYTVWAKLKWPDAQIDCYEPVESNYELLLSNIVGLSYIVPHMSAVGDPELDKIYVGKHNAGECSQYKGAEQTDNVIEIDVTTPESLVSYDIVKLDCEGAEVYILTRLDLSETKFVTYEYHSERNRRACDALLCDQGFTLIGMTLTAQGYGVAKYQRFK
jgi:FkbM family methyltransferase